MAVERVEFTKNEQEFNLLAHVRGWCHNSQECGLCVVTFQRDSADRMLTSIIVG